MANNFYRIKNGLTLPTLSNDPVSSPPAGSVPGDMAFYNGELYVRTAAAWEKVIAGEAQTAEIADSAVTETKLASSAVTEAKLASDSVTDAKVAAAAAISGTKITPDFGAQNIQTTGTVEGSAFLGSDIGASGDTDMKTLHGYGRIASPAQTASAAGNETIDCSLKHVAVKTGGTATITLSNLSEGQTFTLIVTSTGSAYTITWGTTIKWPSGIVPAPTTVAASRDVYSFVQIGGEIFGTVVKDMR